MIKIIFISCFLSTIGVLFVGIESVYFFIPILFSSILLLTTYYKSISYGSTVFHPIPLVCIIMLWSFTLAPAAAVGLDSYLILAPKNINWLPWMVLISWIYLFGVILFCSAATVTLKPVKKIKFDRTYSKKKVILFGIPLLAISLLAQMYIFSRFGGILGYMQSWTDDKSMFDGLGVAFMISEAFPMLLLLVFIFLSNKNAIKKRIWIIALVFIVFVILKIIFGGLRGSRSNTIWGLFWFAGIVHIYYFRLKFSQIVTGLIFTIGFMTIYTLYKSFGVDAFSGNYNLDDTARFEGNPIGDILLGDFSRAGVHAYILSQYYDLGTYVPKLGSTYIDALFKIIPLVDSPFNSYSKNAAAAELFYGLQVNPNSEDIHNSRIFGVYGEGVLNFGPFFAVFSFPLAGFLISKLDNLTRAIKHTDPRALLIPFISNASLMFLLSDTDNFVFFVFKNGFLIIFFIFIILYSRSHSKINSYV